MTRWVPVALLTLLLGCERGPTPYQPVDTFWGPYGYTDLALGADEFAVTVRATAATPDARVADMLLLRAAELAGAHSRTHFVVLHRDTSRRDDPLLVMVPVVLPGAVIPVPVGRAVHAEKAGHLVVRLCASGTDGAVDALAIEGMLRSRLGVRDRGRTLPH